MIPVALRYLSGITARNFLCNPPENEYQKLTKVVAGRTIKAATAEAEAVVLLWDDNSRIKIRTTGIATVSRGEKLKSVQEDETQLKIEFEEGSSATFRLDDPCSAVAVRDKNNAVEYLGRGFGLLSSQTSLAD